MAEFRCAAHSCSSAPARRTPATYGHGRPENLARRGL
jgi:hypothetical protein